MGRERSTGGSPRGIRENREQGATLSQIQCGQQPLSFFCCGAVFMQARYYCSAHTVLIVRRSAGFPTTPQRHVERSVVGRGMRHMQIGKAMKRETERWRCWRCKGERLARAGSRGILTTGNGHRRDETPARSSKTSNGLRFSRPLPTTKREQQRAERSKDRQLQLRMPAASSTLSPCDGGRESPPPPALRFAIRHARARLLLLLLPAASFARCSFCFFGSSH